LHVAAVNRSFDVMPLGNGCGTLSGGYSAYASLTACQQVLFETSVHLTMWRFNRTGKLHERLLWRLFHKGLRVLSKALLEKGVSPGFHRRSPLQGLFFTVQLFSLVVGMNLAE